MATLTNTQINQTYVGLLKFADNGAVQPTALKALSDGTGGSLPISVSQVETKFASGSLVDFTGTTITGLPISPSGLEAGTGPDAMKSAAFLSPNAAVASGSGAIALGNAANATGSSNSISIGNYGTAGSPNGIRIGSDNSTGGDGLISLGHRGSVTGNVSVGIGFEASVSGNASINIATTSQSFGSVTGNGSIALVPGDYAANVANDGCIVIGNAATNGTRVNGENQISIGKSSACSGGNSISIGVDSSSSGSNAVAIGPGIEATRDNTTSVAELECKTTGGGVVMYSPNGTGYKLTVSDAGAAVFTAI